MVSAESVERQLKRIGFKQHSWGRGEVKQLPEILLPDEEIFEIVNGLYEGGFAMLVATDIRVLLIDQKPFNYLTVEDLRFDMINEIDYNHRLFGAYVGISTGNRNLRFRSYNQPRLRKLISHVQHCMAASKKQEAHHQEDQKQHLEQINERLQTYLMAQHQHQQGLEQQYKNAQQVGAPLPQAAPPRPDPELSDYLFAQSLLAEYQNQTGQPVVDPAQMAGLQQLQAASQAIQQPAALPIASAPPQRAPAAPVPPAPSIDDLHAEGMQEVFGSRAPAAADLQSSPTSKNLSLGGLKQNVSDYSPLEINSLKIAYSKLPMALRNRKFGRPSLHAHSQQAEPAPQIT